MKAVCVKCQTELKVADGGVGVAVVEMAFDPPAPYKVWMADLLECRGCGMQIVGNFGDRPVAAYHDAAQIMLDDILRIGKATVIYDYERPQTQAQPESELPF